MDLTQDQAQANLKSGGLQGSQYDAANKVLADYYKQQAAPQVPPTPPTPVGATPAPTTPTTPTVPKVSKESTDLTTATKQMTDLDADYQKHSQQVQNTLTSIMNGAMPLSAGEQAQIDGLKASYQTLVDQQVLSNTNSTGLGNIRGYQTGSAEYDPTFQAKVIGSIVSSGAQKVADLNTQMASSVAKLTMAFQEGKAELVKESWSAYKDAADSRKETIQKTIEEVQSRIKAIQDAKTKAEEQTQKDLVDLSKTVINNGQPELATAVLNAPDLASAMEIAGSYAAGGTGVIGEYNRYVADSIAHSHVPLTFSAYQDMDANRKRSIVNINGGGLSNTEQTKFLNITTKYQADSVVNAAIKAGQIKEIANQIIANPNSATNQLASLYLYVKNLDPDSAVREGELGLAGKTQSYLQTYGNSITRLSKGQVLSPQAAKDLALATKSLVSTWEDTADKKTKLYQAQANNTSPSVGNAFDSYIQDYNDSTNDPVAKEDQAMQTVIDYGQSNTGAQQAIKSLAGVVQPDLGRAYTWEEIAQIVGAQ